MKSRAVLEVKLHLLKKNCETLKKLNGDSFFCPMLKADAYGHGAVPVAKALLEDKVKQAGVIGAEEAWPIRELAEDMDILIFGPLLNPEDLSWIVEEKLVIVCSNWLDLKNVSQLKKPSRIHLKFDTGFSRLGFDLSSAGQVCDFLKDNPQIQLEGLATQLIAGEELGDKNSFSFHQLKRFAGLRSYFSCPNFHVFNTSALTASFVHNEKTEFGARPGIGLYGLKPEIFLKDKNAENKWRDLSFFPVSSLKSTIVDIHQIPKGAPVSYGGSWKAGRSSQIAVVSLGYGDGFLRSLGSIREVLFRGTKRPIVGAVCMDFFMVDVTDLDQKGENPIQLGEEVVIFGQQGDLFLSPQEQAESSGTISYELFSRLGDRVERVYKLGAEG